MTSTPVLTVPFSSCARLESNTAPKHFAYSGQD